MAVLRKQKQIIKGSHLMIFVKNTLGEYEPIAFAQSHTLSKVLNVKDIMSKDFGDASAVMPQNYSWSMQTDNLYSLQGYKQLNDVFKQMKRVRIYFGESTYKQDTPQNSIVDKDGASDWKTDGFGEEGDAYITSLDVTASAGDNATFSATFTGTGPLRQIEGYESKYLTFEALEDTTQFIFYYNDVQYSIDDGNTWTTLAGGSWSPVINAGNKILWKQVSRLEPDAFGIGVFDSTKRFNAYGNVMSLLYGDDFRGRVDISNYDNFLFAYLFSGMGGLQYLIDASNLILPATALSVICYYRMFSGCSRLIGAPKLPATILTEECYEEMFKGCTSLTTAPELPATTLAMGCYEFMFYGCTSLTTAPELPATTLARSCYNQMFNSCTALTTAPELPATVLTISCYSNMFSNCTSLNSVKCLATSGINTYNSTAVWLSNVSSSGTFIKDANTTWPTGNSGIPSGWTVQNA